VLLGYSQFISLGVRKDRMPMFALKIITYIFLILHALLTILETGASNITKLKMSAVRL
jgi:hypothetical protein